MTARTRPAIWLVTALAAGAVAVSAIRGTEARVQPPDLVHRPAVPAACTDAPSTSPILTVERGAARYDRDCVVAAAGRVVTITFVQPDPLLPHDLVVAIDDGALGAREATGGAAVEAIASSGVVRGGEVAVAVPALLPGDYHFWCTLHPQMRGTYRVR